MSHTLQSSDSSVLDGKDDLFSTNWLDSQGLRCSSSVPEERPNFPSSDSESDSSSVPPSIRCTLIYDTGDYAPVPLSTGAGLSAPAGLVPLAPPSCERRSLLLAVSHSDIVTLKRILMLGWRTSGTCPLFNTLQRLVLKPHATHVCCPHSASAETNIWVTSAVWRMRERSPSSSFGPR